MSNPRDDWWPNAVRMVRNYPARKAEWEDLHRQNLTANLSGMPKAGTAGRSTEEVALRQMPPMKQHEYDAVTRAVAITKLLPDGDKRIELIDRVYWRGKKISLNRVIYRIGIGEATAKRWHAQFIRQVGECAGYLN